MTWWDGVVWKCEAFCQIIPHRPPSSSAPDKRVDTEWITLVSFEACQPLSSWILYLLSLLLLLFISSLHTAEFIEDEKLFGKGGEIKEKKKKKRLITFVLVSLWKPECLFSATKTPISCRAGAGAGAQRDGMRSGRESLLSPSPPLHKFMKTFLWRALHKRQRYNPR